MSLDLSDAKVRRRVNKAFRERGVAAKVCGKCFVVKGYEAFNTCARDGLQARCRSCNTARSSEPKTKAYRAAYRLAHIDRERARNKARYAADPEADKARVREWRRKNPKRFSEHSRAWVERRRAIKKGATTEPFTTRDLRHDWEDHDLYACFFCGGPLTDGYEVEHFYPLLPPEGSGVPRGPHALFNLVPSCMPCNRGAGGKGTKEPWGYLSEALAEQGIDLDAVVTSMEANAARRSRI